MFMKTNYMKYLISLLLFGSNGVVASAIIAPSYEIAFLRPALGAIALFVLFFLFGKRPALYRNPRDFALVAGSGAALGICWIFIYTAYTEIGVSLTSLLYALGPVMVMALSPILFKEKFTVVSIVGFAVVLLGAVLANGPVAASGSGIIGIVHGFIAAVGYAVMIVLYKRADTSDGLECSAVQLMAAALTVLAAIVITRMPIVAIPQESIVAVLVIGFVNAGLGCYLYFSSIGNLSAQTVAVCGYLEPISSIVFSAALLGEIMLGSQWLGAFLVVAGSMSIELAKHFASREKRSDEKANAPAGATASVAR